MQLSLLFTKKVKSICKFENIYKLLLIRKDIFELSSYIISLFYSFSIILNVILRLLLFSTLLF